jgi:8-oxo-dGTP diphosphatase
LRVPEPKVALWPVALWPKEPKRFCPLCGGRLERISREGRMRLYCGQCDRILYENPLPATAAAVLHDENDLLLVKRAMEPARGEWCLPGGFVELDETPEQGVLRELREETGLEGTVDHLIGVVPEASPLYGPLIIIGYEVSAHGGRLKAGDDAAEVKYFPLRGLPPLAFDSHQALIDAMARRKR